MSDIEVKPEEKVFGLSIKNWLKVIGMGDRTPKTPLENIDTTHKDTAREIWL